MANQGGEAAGGAPAPPAPAAAARAYKIPFPQYDCAGGTEVLDAFLRRYNAWCLNNNMTPEQVAQTSEYAMKGEALTFLFALRARNVAAMDNFATITAELQARFGVNRTPSELALARATLQQKVGETVQSFLDRCHIVQRMYDTALVAPAVPAAAAANAVKLAWETAIHNFYTLSHFLAGLDEKIKTVVMDQPALTTLDEYLTAAVQVQRRNAEETARGKKAGSKAVFAAVYGTQESDPETELQGLMAKVDALQMRMGGKKKLPQPQQQPRQQQQQQPRAAPQPADPNETRTCYNCQTVGHLSQHCPYEKRTKAERKQQQGQRQGQGQQRQQPAGGNQQWQRPPPQQQVHAVQAQPAPQQWPPMQWGGATAQPTVPQPQHMQQYAVASKPDQSLWNF